MINPLKDLVDDIGDNGFATGKWVVKFLRRVFAKLNVTVEGGDVSQNGVGNLHIKVATSEADYPFKVTIEETLASVSLGVIMTWLYGDVPAHTSLITPTIGGGSLSTAKIVVNGNGYIALRMKHSKLDGNPIEPWSIVFTGTLREETLRRKFGTDNGADSTIDFPIAKITGGQVETQIVRSNLVVQAIWNTIDVSRV